MHRCTSHCSSSHTINLIVNLAKQSCILKKIPYWGWGWRVAEVKPIWCPTRIFGEKKKTKKKSHYVSDTLQGVGPALFWGWELHPGIWSLSSALPSWRQEFGSAEVAAITHSQMSGRVGDKRHLWDDAGLVETDKMVSHRRQWQGSSHAGAPTKSFPEGSLWKKHINRVT